MHLHLSIYALLATASAVCSAAPYVFPVHPSSSSKEAFGQSNKERGTAFSQFETSNRDSKDSTSPASLIGDSLTVESSSSHDVPTTTSANEIELRREFIGVTTMATQKKHEESINTVPKDIPDPSSADARSGAKLASVNGTIQYSNKCNRCDFIKRFLGLSSKLGSRAESSNTTVTIYVSNKGRYDVIKRLFRRQGPIQPSPTVSTSYAANRCGRCGVIKRFLGLESTAQPSNTAPVAHDHSNNSGRLGIIKRSFGGEAPVKHSNAALSYHYSNKSGRLGIIKRTLLVLKSAVEPSATTPTIQIANKCGGFCGVIKRALVAPLEPDAQRLHPRVRPTY